MPSRLFRPGWLEPRVALTLACVVAGFSLAVWGFLSIGRLLHHEDALEQADAIFVLSGTRLERVVEAGDLYLEHWAPRIVLSQQLMDGAEVALRQRGLSVPSELDLQRQALAVMGVPATAIEWLDTMHGATSSEGESLHQLVRQRRWHRVIVVTSKLHTARARLALQRRVDDMAVEIVMRGSRYDPTNVEAWWRSRPSLRFGIIELQKMLLYLTGVAD